MAEPREVAGLALHSVDRGQAASVHGALLKLERASEHRAMVQIELDAFMGREPFTTTGRASATATGPDLQAREPIPEHFAVLIGDCVQNMRVALDYLAWQCALRRHPKPDKMTSFPVVKTRDGWEGAVKRSCKDVGDDARRLMEELQPFQERLGPAASDPLWVLNDLARIDRHQVLHVTAASFTGTMHSFVEPQRNGNIPLPPFDQMFSGQYLAAGPEVSAEEAGFVADSPAVRMPSRAWIYVMFDVVFGETAGDLAGMPVRVALGGIENYLRTVVLPRFEDLFSRSG